MGILEDMRDSVRKMLTSVGRSLEHYCRQTSRGMRQTSGSEQINLEADDNTRRSGSSADASHVPVSRGVSPFRPDPHGPGESGDGYVDGAMRLWGKYGAAGIMVRHRDSAGVNRYLLVKAGPGYSQENWQLPGGALRSLETPAQGAAREMSEELEVPQGFFDRLRIDGVHEAPGPPGTHGWKYTTFATTAPERFDPIIKVEDGGAESVAAGWFTDDELRAMVDMDDELHSAFRKNLHDVLALYADSGSPVRTGS